MFTLHSNNSQADGTINRSNVFQGVYPGSGVARGGQQGRMNILHNGMGAMGGGGVRVGGSQPSFLGKTKPPRPPGATQVHSGGLPPHLIDHYTPPRDPGPEPTRPPGWEGNLDDLRPDGPRFPVGTTMDVWTDPWGEKHKWNSTLNDPAYQLYKAGPKYKYGGQTGYFRHGGKGWHIDKWGVVRAMTDLEQREAGTRLQYMASPFKLGANGWGWQRAKAVQAWMDQLKAAIAAGPIQPTTPPPTPPEPNPFDKYRDAQWWEEYRAAKLGPQGYESTVNPLIAELTKLNAADPRYGGKTLYDVMYDQSHSAWLADVKAKRAEANRQGLLRSGWHDREQSALSSNWLGTDDELWLKYGTSADLAERGMSSRNTRESEIENLKTQAQQQLDLALQNAAVAAIQRGQGGQAQTTEQILELARQMAAAQVPQYGQSGAE